MENFQHFHALLNRCCGGGSKQFFENLRKTKTPPSDILHFCKYPKFTKSVTSTHLNNHYPFHVLVYFLPITMCLTGNQPPLRFIYIMIVSHDSCSHDSKISQCKHHCHLLSYYHESTLTLSQRCDSNRTITKM